MAFFKDGNGKIVEVNEAVDIKDWVNAGFEQVDGKQKKRGRPKATEEATIKAKIESASQDSTKDQPKNNGLVEEDV